MNQVLRLLAILGVVLIAGGFWTAFQDHESANPSRSPETDPLHDERQTERQSPERADPRKSANERWRTGGETVRDEQRANGNAWGNPSTLEDHFVRHGADFRARNEEDYARQAHQLLQRARTSRLPAKRDADGTLRIFDPRTGAFGAYNADGTTRTYFKPDSPTYFDRQPGVPVDLRKSP